MIEIPENILLQIADFSKESGAELIEIKAKGHKKSLNLEVFIDSPQGVMVEMCEEISRKINEIYEKEAFFENVGTISVSSPGIDRPLKYNWQYGRNIGRTLKVKQKNGETKLGKLIEVGEKSIIMTEKKTSKQKQVEKLEILFENIEKAVVEIVF